MTAKGPTPPEIAGAWQAIVEFDTATVEVSQEAPLVDNCGTGMDSLKTFNVSSAAAVVAAAGGVRMARHGARGLTSACGTVDLLEAVGIAVECDVAAVARSIETCGIGLFNGMSPRVHPRALFRILSQIRFGSILNIAASLASPCRPSHAVRGVYAADLLTPVTRVVRLAQGPGRPTARIPQAGSTTSPGRRAWRTGWPTGFDRQHPAAEFSSVIFTLI